MVNTVGINSSTTRTIRLLDRTNEALSSTFERLSSGLRINRGSDDPAGLAVASSLNFQSKIYSQSIRNANDVISVINITQGALSEMGSVMTRIEELAIQASSSTYSSSQRKALETEANALVEEYNRIVDSTSFNGLYTLNGSLQNNPLSVQLGYTAAPFIDLQSSFGGLSGDGTFGSPVTATTATGGVYNTSTVDLNGDGNLDLLIAENNSARAWVYLGNGNGTFQAGVANVAGSNITETKAVDLNGDGNLDLISSDGVFGTGYFHVYMGNGDGSYTRGVSKVGGNTPVAIAYGDINNDGKTDIALANLFGNNVTIFQGDGTGSFTAAATLSSINGAHDVEFTDYDGDGQQDLVVAAFSSGGVYLYRGNSTFSFGGRTFHATGAGTDQVTIGDLNRDGYTDVIAKNRDSDTLSVLLTGAGGTVTSKTSYAQGTTLHGNMDIGDFNGDGIIDIARQMNGTTSVGLIVGNGDGSFKAAVSTSAAGNSLLPTTGDFNNDGVLDILAVGSNILSYLQGTAVQTQKLTKFSWSTSLRASESLSSIREVREEILLEQASTGATQRRIEVAMMNLQVGRENARVAESRIVSADVAEEAASLVRLSVLRDAGAAVLAQANQQPSLVLALLRP